MIQYAFGAVQEVTKNFETSEVEGEKQRAEEKVTTSNLKEAGGG